MTKNKFLITFPTISLEFYDKFSDVCIILKCATSNLINVFTLYAGEVVRVTKGVWNIALS